MIKCNFPNFSELSGTYKQSKGILKNHIISDTETYIKLLENNDTMSLYDKIVRSDEVYKALYSKFKFYIDKDSKNIDKYNVISKTVYNVCENNYDIGIHLDRRYHILSQLHYVHNDGINGKLGLYSSEEPEDKIYDMFPKTEDVKLVTEVDPNPNRVINFLNVPYAYHAAEKFTGNERSFIYTCFDIRFHSGNNLLEQNKGCHSSDVWNYNTSVKSEDRRQKFLKND